MLTLNAASIQNEPERWEAAGVRLPSFDRAAMKTFTKTSPAWLNRPRLCRQHKKSP